MTTAPANAAQPKSKAWHNQSAEDVLTQLGSSAAGLSGQDTICYKREPRKPPALLPSLFWYLLNSCGHSAPEAKPSLSGDSPFLQISISLLWLSFHSASRCGANTMRRWAVSSERQTCRSVIASYLLLWEPSRCWYWRW